MSKKHHLHYVLVADSSSSMADQIDEVRDELNIQIEKMPGWKDPIYWKDDIKLDDEEDNVIHIFKDAMALHVSDTQKIETIKSEKAEIDELYSNTRKGLISELEQFNKDPELVLE